MADHGASDDELDEEALLRSGATAAAAFGEPDGEALLTNDGPWVCVSGGAAPKRRSEHGLAASVEASQPMSGRPGFAATGSASRSKSDALEVGAFC